MRRAWVMTAAAAVALASAFPSARAAEEIEISVSIKDHKFEPAELKVPTGKPIKLTVNNLDVTPEEFESKNLGIEKVVGGKGSAVIRIKPLTGGTYTFIGEYHE